MNRRTSHRLKRLMIIFFLGLIIVVVGLGLATGRNPQSGIPAGSPPIVPVWMPVPAMPIHAAPTPLQPNAQIALVNQVSPQNLWELCPPVKASTPATRPSGKSGILVASKQIDMIPFQEAHWQGLELIPMTGNLRQIMKITPDAKGVIVDEVTWPADKEGFLAGDLITSVGQIPTPNLEGFINAANRVRDRRRTEVRLLREDQLHSLVLTANQGMLGTANGETAPMIKPGSRAPHGYMGPCTQCHRIGTKGQLAMDQGDLLSKKAPPIRAGQVMPHRNRGVCNACHRIIQ